jgi:hypothetical protein
MENEDLLDDSYVVRFGLMKVDDLRDAILRCRLALGFYGLSLYGENYLSVEEIAALAKKPHVFIRKSQVGRLRLTGFEVARRGRFPHLTLRFETEPTDATLEALVQVFDEPQLNPHPVE